MMKNETEKNIATIKESLFGDYSTIIGILNENYGYELTCEDDIGKTHEVYIQSYIENNYDELCEKYVKEEKKVVVEERPVRKSSNRMKLRKLNGCSNGGLFC